MQVRSSERRQVELVYRIGPETARAQPDGSLHLDRLPHFGKFRPRKPDNNYVGLRIVYYCGLSKDAHVRRSTTFARSA